MKDELPRLDDDPDNPNGTVKGNSGNQDNQRDTMILEHKDTEWDKKDEAMPAIEEPSPACTESGNTGFKKLYRKGSLVYLFKTYVTETDK